ncbi:hypothetical protein OG716_39350 [Nocardia sp. NBC_01388]
MPALFDFDEAVDQRCVHLLDEERFDGVLDCKLAQANHHLRAPRRCADLVLIALEHGGTQNQLLSRTEQFNDPGIDRVDLPADFL